MSAKNTLEVIRQQAEICKARIEELQQSKILLEHELRRLNDRIDTCKQSLNRLRLDAKIIDQDHP